MSDGERTALVIAAEIISAPPSSVFLIDEPELHLHRSIVVPLLAALMRERDDCAFVISTHELELPTETRDGVVALVRGCGWQGDQVIWWDVDVLPLNEEIPDDLRVDILGSRRKILFVEGIGTSLDQPFYALLFPNVSIRPRQTAREVRAAVVALRALQALHHTRAFGLVDNDSLSPEQVQSLESEGIYALPIATIESLYYSPESLRSVARQQALTLGGDADSLVEAAMVAALGVLAGGNSNEHLASRVAELKLRASVLGGMPDRETLISGSPQVSISVSSPYPADLRRINSLIAAGDVDSIVARYPVRESGILTALAGGLRFRSRDDYERAVLARLATDPTLRMEIIAKLGALAAELG
jgi:hypothetical protein